LFSRTRGVMGGAEEAASDNPSKVCAGNSPLYIMNLLEHASSETDDSLRSSLQVQCREADASSTQMASRS
jgi:hypothetical protein